MGVRIQHVQGEVQELTLAEDSQIEALIRQFLQALLEEQKGASS